jgi:AraC-like DNA-binding protein
MKLDLSNGSYENLKFDDGCYINVAISNNSETFPLHWHAITEIIMPLDGSLEIEINGIAYQLEKHDLLLTSIGELHEIKVPSEGSRIIIQFDFSLINNLNDFNASSSILQQIKLITHKKDPYIHQQIVALIYGIKDDYLHGGAFINAFMYSKLIQIYALIGKKYINMENLFEDITINRQQEYILKFTELLSYINNHYKENLTLEDLAEHAGFSKFHFSRLFNQFTNMNLYDYINHKRISEAELLLLNPSLSITDVSLQAGFNSISTFNRVFKAAKNCTPTQYKHLFSSHLSD